MGAEGSALFRALADFRQLRKEARQSKQEMKGLRDETAASNRELGKTEKETAKASSGLNRLHTALVKVQAGLDKIRGSRVGRQFDQVSDSVGKLFRTIGNVGAKVANLAFVGTAAASSVGGVMSLVAAVVALSGALGALPALAGAGLAAAGTIAVGLIGIQDAFQDTGAAASGMANAQRAADRAALQGAEQVRSARQRVADAYMNGARRVADAERAVIRAQRDSADAQKDLNKAREEAVEQLEDLQLALRGGELDERSAAIQLQRAQQRLQEAIAGGAQGLDLAEAVLGVDEAKLALDEARERYADLRKESENANKAGVDGAENVVDAQRRVQDSLVGVSDAQQALADARVESARDIADAERDLAMAIQEAAWAQEDAAASMTAAAGKAAPVLAKSAQAFVDVVKGLQDEFDSLRLDVQERLFAGLADRVSELADRYFPMLQRSMGGMATTFNGMIHDFADWMSQQSTVDDFGESLRNIEQFWVNIRGAVKPALQSVMDFFVVGSKLLPELGTEVTELTKKFADIVREARESGALEDWIRTGIKQVKLLGQSFWNLGRSMMAVFKAGEESGVGFFETLERITDSLADFLESAEGQSTLQKLFKAASDAGKVLLPILKALVGAVGDIVPILIRIAEKIGPGVVGVIDGLRKAFKEAEPALLAAAAAVGAFLKAVGDLGPFVGELASGVLTVLTPPLEALAKILELVAAGFNALPEPVQDMVGIVGGLGIAIVAFLVIGAKLVSFLKDVVSNAKDAVKWLDDFIGKSKKASDAGGVGGKDGKGTGSGTPPIVAMDADGSRKSGEAAGKAAAEGADKGFKGAWAAAFGALSRIAGVIGIAFVVSEVAGEDPVEEMKKMFGDMKTTLQEEGAIWKEEWGKFNDWAVQRNADATLNISGAWAWVQQNWGTQLEAARTNVGSTWDWIVDKVTTGNNVLGVDTVVNWSTIAQTIDEKTQSAQNIVTTAWDLITGKNDTTWADVRDTVLGAMSEAGLALDEKTGGMISRLGDFGLELYGDFKNAWNDASQTVKDWSSDIQTAIGDAVNWATTKLRDLRDTLSDVGDKFLDSPVNAPGRWLAGLFNKGGPVPIKTGRNQDDQFIGVTGGEWVVPKEKTKQFRPFLEAITYGGDGAAMPFAPEDLLARVGTGSGGYDTPGFAPVSTPRTRTVEGGGTQIGDVHVTQVVNNPAPEKPSVSASKRMGRLARFGLAHAVGSA